MSDIYQRLNLLPLNKPIKRIRKSSVIKNVKYVVQEIMGHEVIIQLDPPRNLKVNNRGKL